MRHIRCTVAGEEEIDVSNSPIRLKVPPNVDVSNALQADRCARRCVGSLPTEVAVQDFRSCK